MTRPRLSVHREILGVLGSADASRGILKEWNARFRVAGMDAAFVRYHCPEKHLPERLSEMFHFDRRGYIVAPELQQAILPFLDSADSSAVEEGRADTVWNDGGVLRGFRMERPGRSAADVFEERWKMWFGNTSTVSS